MSFTFTLGNIDYLDFDQVEKLKSFGIDFEFKQRKDYNEYSSSKEKVEVEDIDVEKLLILSRDFRINVHFGQFEINEC